MTAGDLTELPTSELLQRTVALARCEPVLQSDEYWAHVRALHFRSGRDVFEEAVGLCSNPDAVSRAAGADILAQLGVRDGVGVFPFADESVGPLVALLEDMEPTAIASALYAGTLVEANQRSLHSCQTIRRKTFVTPLRTLWAAAQTPFPLQRWSRCPATSTQTLEIGRRSLSVR